MTIESITSVSSFDTSTGVAESNETYHTVLPSFKFLAGTHVITNAGRFHNEVFKFHLRMDDVNATNFKIMLGCDATGIGRAIQFDFNATNKWVRLVNASGIDVTYDSVISEKDLMPLFNFDSASGMFIECKVIISKNKLQFYYGNRLCVDTVQFTTVGNNWGFCNLTGSSQVWISDLSYIYDQILYGNVNLNGAPDDEGVVIVYNQSTYEVVEYTTCDTNGEYMVFLDDDPANVNKYFLYGFVNGVNGVQPRGVSNITL